GLCSACSKINFEQFSHTDNPTPPSTHLTPNITSRLIFLDRIIRKNRNKSCEFCMLLFKAISAHDPFQHPAVKNHLPSDLAKSTFREWAEEQNWTSKIPVYKSSYPFGTSRDKIEMQQKVDKDGNLEIEDSTRDDEMTTSDVANMGGIGAAAGLGGMMLTETDEQRMKIMMTVGTVIPTITSLMANLDSKLPVAVSVIVHGVGDAEEGVVNVDVWGYGNGHRAPLSRVSAFNLRVASGYEIGEGGRLRYGNLLKDEVDVEGDCKVWLDACRGCHGDGCARPGWSMQLQPPAGPDFRLVDVSAMRVVVVPGQHPTPRYAALSYVWGATGQHSLNLHKHNAAALGTTLHNQDRPVARTIMDAITITRRLGVPFLWVDSLCIIQQSPFDPSNDDPAARAAQIAQMDSIYGNAEITLVAASGSDSESPLLYPRDFPPETQIATVLPTTNINVLLPVSYPTSYSKWDTRAWTLQEKLLSKRLLVFSEGGLQEWDGERRIQRAAFFGEYAKLVGQYSGREMTDSRDSLNAVAGLMKVLERMAVPFGNAGPGLGHTLYGLPERFLELTLMWQPPAVQGVYLTRKPHDMLPSWSWAGWEVGADAAVEAKGETKPGVRFDELFWVGVNDDLSLRKAPKSERPLEERFRPLVMWFRSTKPPSSYRSSSGYPHNASGVHPLVPINGHGLGLAFDDADGVNVTAFLQAAAALRGGVTTPPKVPIVMPLDSRHLVCETQVASFQLNKLKGSQRSEKLWKRTAKGMVVDNELAITEIEVLSHSGEVVGTVVPTDGRRSVSSELYHFILLSEAQYYGNEKRVDVSGMPLFNVMLVEWDIQGQFATRMGVGKVRKTAWWEAGPELKTVVLK
ncbi:heterokaryon incompatibility protein-domain-containing protein, partial [Immersiella caudata]